MRKQAAFLSAAALLLCSAATASAATAMHPSDTVILSAAQRRAVWNDINKQATRTYLKIIGCCRCAIKVE